MPGARSADLTAPHRPSTTPWSAVVTMSVQRDQEPDNEPLLLRPREAAKSLAISERTLHGWTQLGKIPSVRIGGSVRYSVAALTELD
jgi:excisionase family DNA binding protein